MYLIEKETNFIIYEINLGLQQLQTALDTQRHTLEIPVHILSAKNSAHFGTIWPQKSSHSHST